MGPHGPESIDDLFSVRINGTNEWILLRGENRHNPVILLLNGGPGDTGIGLARPFGYETGLERDMVVATWDEANTGKSDDLPASQRSISRYVDDTCKVVGLLKQRLGTNHIYLGGVSFGSFLGILTAARCGEGISAFFGAGQLVSAEEADETSHLLTRNEALRRHDLKSVQILDEQGAPPWSRAAIIQQHNVAANYGGMSQRYRHPPLRALLTPELSLLEIYRSFSKSESLGNSLWAELHRMDLRTLVPTLPMPVFLLEGRFDLVTPPSIAQHYLDRLSAPQKHWTWFEHSAHGVLLDEPEKAGMVIREGVQAIETGVRSGHSANGGRPGTRTRTSCVETDGRSTPEPNWRDYVS
jgi:pimeloyl-ACP methyl ester carboxylesterase